VKNEPNITQRPTYFRFGLGNAGSGNRFLFSVAATGSRSTGARREPDVSTNILWIDDGGYSLSEGVVRVALFR
jgi:hypothetical protein